MLTSALLETKLHVPPARPRLVDRSRLLDRLDQAMGARLTLVSAPAGFGKSTLIAGWLANDPSADRRVAWFSIDRGDSDPTTFWTYLTSALHKAAPEIGGGGLLADPSQPGIDVDIGRLINELSDLSDDVVLVLDDYHALESPDIHESMTYLLEHLPGSVHVVLATRADPPLPLARMRARGELVEIRAADLRFTADEAAAYFHEVAGLDLGADDVAALATRTEGWIAALQLAGLSMQGRDDVTEFIAGFAGDDRYIVDYLVAEVLQRQADAVRSFLLETSILARLNGSLCDAVTEGDQGRAMLEELERENLFLVPLDDRRQWYRYHHLFADVLQARLLDERPNEVPMLHRRASEWHERAGDRSEAIRHAIAGKDFERAADLVELATPETRRNRQDAVRQQWLEALPAEVIRQRPVLSNLFAGTLMVHGKTDGVAAYLDDAERWLDPAAGPPTYVDEEEFRDLPGAIAIHRAGLARLQGDVAATIAHATAARALTREDNELGRGSAAALVGLAQWTTGDLEAADGGYVDAIAHLEKAGYLADVLGCSIALADIRCGLGKLGDALRIYERGLQIATGSGVPVMRGAADMHTGLADVLRERNELDQASRHLDAVAELGEDNGLPQNPYRSRLARARVRQAMGDFDGALALYADAERRYFTDFSPSVRPPSALRARMLVANRQLPEAARWARDQGLSADDELTYVRELEHATLARLLVAQERPDEALALLTRLLAAAEQGGRPGTTLDLLVAQSLAFDASGDLASALAALERALELAEPEGYVRLFLDEGPPMATLVKRAAAGRTTSDAVQALAGAFAPSRQVTPNQWLVEPLSERELDVLRLLAGDLDGPGIANELIVSLNTVRTHTKNIYAKLGVNSRRAAVRRAADLGLVSSGTGGPTP
ncbi:MAG TPA: LuxR C-terminal-related transcriptional regulator [Candidatus Limnocylindria bacterium]